MGNSLETQALLLAAPTRDSPQTPFVLTLTQRTRHPILVYHLTLSDCATYVG